jgi:plasmid stabilization system protein ParE
VKVVWTKQAKSDIASIHRYIAQDSEYYAVEVVDTILAAEIRIGEYPTAGGLVRERLRKDIRQVHRYSYRIIYRILVTRIDVLTVIHEKRQLSLDLKE